ncbi:type I DNA topoisomerase [Candidatus Uhrbacteria bacterium]|jgi:DNA topoisomerase I|nr:type I DNA topoisomerase [Candidatus Uhrbacteria bacterium]
MKRLLIVESPTKAKTIKKFLGSDYEVTSSFGHIRDLPRKEMGVDMDNKFEPTYVVPDNKKKRVADLKRAAKGVDEIYLATDEDREGEAIAWHIAEILKIKTEDIKRITFHEITKHAIEHALTEAKGLAMPVVEAQQTRRILDRLVGYELSPFLWSKVRRGLSAGRVQSVCVRLVVERERERNAFDQDEYWTIEGLFETGTAVMEGKLNAVDGEKLKKLSIGTEAAAAKIIDDLKGASFTVDAITKKQASRKPPKPLTTSSLQQEANNKLGFSAKQTMTLAQKLYETGRITYMRTDSLNLADKFLGEAQSYIKATFGDNYATGAQTYKTKKKGAQEAHEAIRPTDPSLHPDKLQAELEAGQWKLYNLIWRRTLATQFPPAKLESTAIDLLAKTYNFRANGSVIVFDGFMKIYKSAKETILPELKKGDDVKAQSITPEQHFTQPPGRYSDATLVKVLEEHGIGRPSTYAPTISTVIDRGYVDRDDNKKLFPTDTAYIVTDLLVEHFPNIVNLEFTATMERTLDEIAEGTVHRVPTLEAFYGPFHKNLQSKTKEITYADVVKERELGADPESGKMIVVKTGRFGPYVQLGEWSEEDRKEKINKPKMASLMKDMDMETVKLEEVLKLFTLPRTVGQLEDGTPITAQTGPYGPYLKAGKTNASIEEPQLFSLDEKEARELIIETAKKKAEMMKPLAELGADTVSGEPIVVKNGRFGPYVTDGKTNASISKKIDPMTVTLEMATEMLIKKRERQAKKGGAKKGEPKAKPLKKKTTKKKSTAKKKKKA